MIVTGKLGNAWNCRGYWSETSLDSHWFFSPTYSWGVSNTETLDRYSIVKALYDLLKLNFLQWCGKWNSLRLSLFQLKTTQVKVFRIFYVYKLGVVQIWVHGRHRSEHRSIFLLANTLSLQRHRAWFSASLFDFSRHRCVSRGGCLRSRCTRARFPPLPRCDLLIRGRLIRGSRMGEFQEGVTQRGSHWVDGERSSYVSRCRARNGSYRMLGEKNWIWIYLKNSNCIIQLFHILACCH